MKKLSIITMGLSMLILTSSCLGSYSAFNSLKDWNSQVSDNKFVNNLLFWGLNIIPVYGLFFVGDTLIFNVIEFWSGSNPIAMAPNETETQTIVKNGNTYEMTASQNQMLISVIEGNDKGNSLQMNYNPEEKTWYATTQEGETIKLSSFEDGFYMVYLPDGEKVKMDITTSKEQGMAIINAKLYETNKGYAVLK